MKYRKVTVLTLPDNSFLICVPLIDEERERFERRLSSLLRKREERMQKSSQNGIPSQVLTVFTDLSKEEVEEISNNIVRKILKKSRRQRKRKGQG